MSHTNHHGALVVDEKLTHFATKVIHFRLHCRETLPGREMKPAISIKEEKKEITFWTCSSFSAD